MVRQDGATGWCDRDGATRGVATGGGATGATVGVATAWLDRVSAVWR